MAAAREKTEPDRALDLEPLDGSSGSVERRRRWHRLSWIAAGLGLPALFFVWSDGFPGKESAEIPVKLVFALVVLALVVAREFAPAARRGQAGRELVLAAVLAVIAYFNLGGFHGHSHVHHWEQFHYALGAKYFPELGYDGLYAASIEAQLAIYPDEAPQRRIRDLRSNVVVRTDALATREHRKEVVARFSAERWASFIEDHRFFLDYNTRDYLRRIRHDHGFNPPPSWTFVARLFAAWPRLDATSVGALAMLDNLLLAALFVVIFKTWGPRLGCLALVLFGINYAGRYYWVGGAFLREDWLAAVGIAICMLRQKRYHLAGALFGYAAMVRIFPLLFLFGPAVVAARDLLRGQRPRWILNLGLGFVLAVAFALGAGCLTGRGPAAWNDFARAIDLHKGTWLTNNVGLTNVLLYDGETMRRELVNFSLPEPWIQWQAKMDRLQEKRRGLLLLAQAVMLLLVAGASWRLDLPRSAMLGMVVVFALLLTTCYYWQMLLLVPLLRDRKMIYGAFALQIGLYILHFATPAFEMRYGMMSWGLLVIFLLYLGSRIAGRARRAGHLEG